jgi:hypothetical protein
MLPPVISLEHAALRVEGRNTNDYIGSAMALGDVDADGVADLLVGGPFSDVEFPGQDRADNAGEAFLFYGGKADPDSLKSTADADMVFLGDPGGWRKGSTFYGAFAGAAVSIADLDGDGFGDVIIAAPLAESHGALRPRAEDMLDVGAVYVVSGQGRATGRTRLHDAFSKAFFGFHEGDYFGGVLGEPVWSSSRYDRVFSPSLATGDFNGDGITDLAVGAPGADGARSVGDATDDAGAAYVFLGRGRR